MTDPKPRHIIVHGHIFKNAGTSFDWSLKRNFGDGFIDHKDQNDKYQRAPAYLAGFLDAAPGLKAIASHHLHRWMPLPQRTRVNLIPCFLLRHPIERVRSVYNFERNQESDTLGAIAAKKMNFKDFIAWRMCHMGGGVVMNYQIRYCSGRRKKGLAIADELIPETADYLSSVALTGIVDRYDESMVYMEEHLRKFFPEIDLACARQNVGSQADVSLSVGEKVDAIFKELGSVASELEKSNKADLALYSLANKSLDSHIARIPDFERKLEEFRIRSKKLS